MRRTRDQAEASAAIQTVLTDHARALCPDCDHTDPARRPVIAEWVVLAVFLDEDGEPRYASAFPDHMLPHHVRGLMGDAYDRERFDSEDDD